MNRCALCPGVNTLVPPSGPRTKGQPLFIGEAPGKVENQRGRPFEGKTGEEVNDHYLPLAGLRRSDCTFTNAIACWPTSNGGKIDLKQKRDRALLQCCSDTHLLPLIADLEPSLLVPMGAFACHAIDPNINLELQHGTVVDTQWGIPAFPMYHPAGGLHEPKKMLLIRTDWIRLRQHLAGTLVAPVDEYPDPDYAEITAVEELEDYCGDVTAPMGADTESSPSVGPYCLTLSTRPGTGRLIRAERTDLLQAFQGILHRWESVILFHHWLYDRAVVGQMGLRFPESRIRDTLLRIFHLGNLPQGLKALAYRELGMVMADFDDVVRPYSQAKVWDYYQRAAALTWAKPEPQLEQDSKTGLWKVYSPQSMNTKFKRFFTDFSKNPDKDVFKMWTDNWVAEQDMIETAMGERWPGFDIAHVPFEHVIDYACRDSDATLRLWFRALAMRRRVRGYPQERWGEAA